MSFSQRFTCMHTHQRLVSLSATVVLTAAMLAAATIFHNTSLVFPEGAAVTLGCWFLQEEQWIHKPWQIVLLPTFGAALGVALNHAPVATFVRLSLALFAIMTVLYLRKSSVSPSISAALLPIALQIQSWVFVLSVFLLTLFVAAVVFSSKSQRTVKSFEGSKRDRTARDAAFFAVCIVWFGVSTVFQLHWMVIPPLMVVLFEGMAKVSPLPLTLRHTAMLFCAALFGTLTYLFWPNLFVVAGSVAVIATVALMWFARTWLAPCLAIAQLPMLLHLTSPWLFPLYVLLMSGFVGLASLSFSRARKAVSSGC